MTFLEHRFCAFWLCLVGIFSANVFLTTAEAAELRGWPLREEMPIADGEDATLGKGDERYFGFGPYSFIFRADPGTDEQDVSVRTREIEMAAEEGREGLKISAPPGALWLLDRVWSSAGAELILWMGYDDEGRFLQVATTSPFKLLTRLPLVASSEKMWPFSNHPVAIDKRRIYFHTEVPEVLRDYFPPANALTPKMPFWQDAMGTDHRDRLEKSRDMVRQGLQAAVPDKEGIAAQKQVAELIQTALVPIDSEALIGNWKVRSFQGSPGAHYAYPFFKSRIIRRDGGLFFEKFTGSQRRSGFIFPDQAKRWVFLGGKTVNEEPQTSYSGLEKIDRSDASAPLESDSFGTVEQLGKDRLLMILDVLEDGEYEIYEMVRQNQR